MSAPGNLRSWSWPDSLDALVAAPAHHRLMMEDDRVRVIHTRVPAGDTVPLHTHRWPSVLIVLSTSHFIRRDDQGNVLHDSRQGEMDAPDSAFWYPALPPHSLENVGQAEISVINVEMKDL